MYASWLTAVFNFSKCVHITCECPEIYTVSQLLQFCKSICDAAVNYGHNSA